MPEERQAEGCSLTKVAWQDLAEQKQNFTRQPCYLLLLYLSSISA
jgi:hypothetical protein